MQESDDFELLAQYARNHSEAAFTALVQRYVNLVYSTAMRHVGNPHQAEEITQAVFLILANKAPGLSRSTILSGWLYQTARLTAANFVRSEFRRACREHEAFMQSHQHEPKPEEAWQQIAPLLEDAMGHLTEKDRNIIVLRFFDSRSLRQVGEALGVNEDAAKMRVLRALDKLRKWFGKRGINLTSVAIAGAVSANSIQAAPADLAVSIATSTVHGSVAATSTLALAKGVVKLMAWTKLKTAMLVVAGVLLAVGTVTMYWSGTPVVPHEIVGEPRPPEPEYQGRRLSQWLSANPPVKVISLDDIVTYRRTALRAMGAPAIRYLHWMVAHPEHAIDGNPVDPTSGLNTKAPQTSPQPVHFANVVVALQWIGPEARDAAPDLARLWQSRGNPMYGNFNGFPLALASLGNASPEILTALHRNFSSQDRLHRALCAFSMWQLNPGDDQALDLLRRELSTTDSEVHARYALLETVWRYGSTNVTPLLPAIRNLIESKIAKPEYQAIAARAAWRILMTPDPAIALIQGMGPSALKPKAAVETVNRFASVALDLSEIPGVSELAIPILRRLLEHSDESAADFAANILERLETRAEGGGQAPAVP